MGLQALGRQVRLRPVPGPWWRVKMPPSPRVPLPPPPGAGTQGGRMGGKPLPQALLFICPAWPLEFSAGPSPALRAAPQGRVLG